MHDGITAEIDSPPRDRPRDVVNLVRSTGAALLDLLYPPHCVLCNKFGIGPLCAICLAEAALPLPPPVCSRCGRPCAALPCSDCLADPPAYLAAVSAGDYSGTLREAVHWLKYRDRPMLAEPLGLIMAESARHSSALLGGIAMDAVVPVPLHHARQRVRGYNQAERLARVVSRELDLPLDKISLKRVRNTKSQVGRTASARQTNVDNAFAAVKERVAGKTLLLIDDVTTTGTTLKRCSEEIKNAGAKAVYCLALAAG